MMKDVGAFRGVFMRDQLPKKIKPTEYGIVNLDSSTGPGTHWVCYVVDKKLPFNLYFDSFGLPPPEELVDYLSGKKLTYNSSQIQNIESSACGYYCVDIIKRYDKGEDIYELLYKYDQKPTMRNENLV